MKINAEVLSIPPYLSTSWKNVQALRAERFNDSFTLFVNLTCGATVEIPSLPRQAIEDAFHAHAIQSERSARSNTGALFPSMEIPMPFLDKMTSFLQHNPEDSSAPPLPLEILERIRALSSILPQEEINNLPDFETGCQCTHCQILRALHGERKNEMESLCQEEIVSDKELSFSDWLIDAISHNLYKVTNPANETESYNVFIGSPVGCTCGSCQCQHIEAVLRT